MRKVKRKIETESGSEDDGTTIAPSHEKDESENFLWTKEDKKTLLLGLKTHGEKNLTAISQMLPHIPLKVIKTRIALYSALSEHLYQNRIIDDWLASGMCRPSTLADVALFISLFEKQPNPANCKGINFCNIYNIIYQTFMNESDLLKLFEKKEMSIIFEILNKLNKTVWPKFMNELFQYLSTNYKKRQIWKVYKGKKATTL